MAPTERLPHLLGPADAGRLSERCSTTPSMDALPMRAGRTGLASTLAALTPRPATSPDGSAPPG